MRIISIGELNQVQDIPVVVRQQMERVLNVLDEAYGVNRAAKMEGGYVLYITNESKTELNEFFSKYPLALPEYVDVIDGCDDEFVEALVMLGADYSVVIYIERKNLNEFPLLLEELNEA